MKRTTLSVMDPVRRKSILEVDDERLIVTKVSGAGPYMLAVRRYRWTDRIWRKVRYYASAPKRFIALIRDRVSED